MNKKEIGKFIQRKRIEQNLTQEKLGELLFTSRENVSKWERGL